MKNNKLTIVVYVIIAFAAIGFFSQLFGNTKNFLISVFIMVGIAAAMFALFNYFLQNQNRSSNETKKYKQAVRQSKMKYQKPEKNGKVIPKQKLQSPMGTVRKNKKRPAHLKVIKGSKTKNKDSASS